jgi:hypothetical protein
MREKKAEHTWNSVQSLDHNGLDFTFFISVVTHIFLFLDDRGALCRIIGYDGSMLKIID